MGLVTSGPQVLSRITGHSSPLRMTSPRSEPSWGLSLCLHKLQAAAYHPANTTGKRHVPLSTTAISHTCHHPHSSHLAYLHSTYTIPLFHLSHLSITHSFFVVMPGRPGQLRQLLPSVRPPETLQPPCPCKNGFLFNILIFVKVFKILMSLKIRLIQVFKKSKFK